MSKLITIAPLLDRAASGLGRRTRCTHASALLATMALALVWSAVSAEDAVRAAADGMHAKIERLRDAAMRPRTDHSQAETTFSEREINAYLQIYGPEVLPPGVTHPQVALAEGGHVRARAVVDFDAVRLSRPRGLFDPLAFARGALEVVALGSVEGRDGRGVIRLDSATVAGVTVPRVLVEELLQFYTRTPDRPAGFELDKPFPLPGTLRSVVMKPGSASVTH